MSAATIGNRLKALREQKNLSQDEVARQFGFKDRQTLSAIETGERRVSAEELLRAVQVFNVPLDFFTDPFLLAGEGAFSWRQSGVASNKLATYEQTAGRWIAAFRELGSQLGQSSALLRPSLKLTEQSSFDEAVEAGERFAAEFKLGSIPAERLAQVMERDLHQLVLMVEAIQGVSGAACRLPDLDVVLINRREVPGRRNFDLAHELFHLLTWDRMPPSHEEEVEPVKRTHVEKLADTFASAVLMPAKTVDKLADWETLNGDALIDALNAAANELQVTASALRWRLVDMKRLGKIIAGKIPAERLRNNGRKKVAKETTPPLFSKAFVEVVARAIDQGRVTARRVSYLLNIAMDELPALFESHGVKAPFEL